jgi:adenosylmethionine-8-amino-7-oxononanoate aminotransferase
MLKPKVAVLMLIAAAGVSIGTVSKALSGGTLPLAATVARKSAFEAFWSDDPQKALIQLIAKKRSELK